MTNEQAMEFVTKQLAERGVASVHLADGNMFFFTKELLAELLIKASGDEGRVGIFIPKVRA